MFYVLPQQLHYVGGATMNKAEIVDVLKDRTVDELLYMVKRTLFIRTLYLGTALFALLAMLIVILAFFAGYVSAVGTILGYIVICGVYMHANRKGRRLAEVSAIIRKQLGAHS